MTRNQNVHPRPTGHVPVAAATIGGLSMILSGGLEWLGFLKRVNAGIARFVARDGAETFPQHVAGWCLWLATGVFAFGLAAAMLGTPGQGRRALLWITSVVLVTAWAPVLSLAAHAPDIAAPWIATLWSGVCALVYTANHRMTCDDQPTPSNDPR